jgi:serine/threonine-protein kinase
VAGLGLLRIRDDGGPPETLAMPGNGESGLTSPQILPGGKAVLFSAYTGLSPDAASIEVMTLAGRQRKTVVRGGTSPRYLAASNGAGYLVYVNRATLFAVPFDLDRLETRGTALPILDDVAFHPLLGIAQASFSNSGTIVYRKGGGDSGLLTVTVAWLDSAGKTRPLVEKPGVYGRPILSPDGQRLALEVQEASGGAIWVYDIRRDTMTRLTFTGIAQVPVWSPDGRYIVFSSGPSIWATRSDGAGQPRPLTQGSILQHPWSFTADGKRLAFHQGDPKTSYDLWTVPVESDDAGMRAGKPEVFLQSPADERCPSFSPDGRWMAYMSTESGTAQVYVRAFPDKGGKWQISNTGGAYPMWTRGDAAPELFFETLDNRIMVAPYTVQGDSFVAGKPRLWSDTQLAGMVNTSRNVDLASDGKRVVALMPAGEGKGTSELQNRVVFLLNFFDELRRKAPPGQ